MQLANPTHIRWGCRRGMLELDLLLIPFFDQCFSQLTIKQQQTFVQLLAQPDPELYSWLMGHAKSDQSEFQELITLIKNHAITTPPA